MIRTINPYTPPKIAVVLSKVFGTGSGSRIILTQILIAFCVSAMEYVLPRQLTALSLFACMIPLANPKIMIALPKNVRIWYLRGNDKPFFASSMLAT